MKKYLQLPSLAFTLLFTYNFAHAEADNNLKDTENTDDKITLNSMAISANHINQSFLQTNSIKENLDASSDGTGLLKRSLVSLLSDKVV